jgi:transglutaminase-like putative cysteine protease
MVGDSASAYERAVRIEEELRASRRLDPSAPAGSSYARLAELLDSPRASGTAEQFASAFAVLARAAGLPTRVVVGFQPVERDQDGLWVVRGRDALAWPEVYLTGVGWVAFDPRPLTLSRG